MNEGKIIPITRVKNLLETVTIKKRFEANQI